MQTPTYVIMMAGFMTRGVKTVMIMMALMAREIIDRKNKAAIEEKCVPRAG